MNLTPEDQSKLRDRELANIIRKLHAGKTLTAREQSKLDAATAGPGVDATGYVGTWDELAGRLDVTRRAIQDWRNDPRHAPEIARRKNLLERADGRHCVAEWLKLMVDLRLNRGKAPAEAQDGPETDRDDESGVIKPPAYGGSQADWTKARIAKDVELKDIEIDSTRGTLLEAAELEGPLGATLAAIQVKLSQFPDTAARRVCGLRDEAECREVLRDEMDAILTDLHGARYNLDDALAVAVAAVPFDAESEKLFAAVCFDGQDRGKLLELVAAVATEALRRLGRGAIANAQHEAVMPDTAIADAVTGQVTDIASDREAASRMSGQSPESSIEEKDFSDLQKPGDIATAKSQQSHARSVRESQPTRGGSQDKVAQPVAAAGSEDSSDKPSHQKKRPVKARRKARPKPTPPPGEIEGAIHEKPRKATRRRRK